MISTELATLLKPYTNKLILSDGKVLCYLGNIHELGNICKQWALTKNIAILSKMGYCGKAKVEWTEYMGSCRAGYMKQHTYSLDWVSAPTEPEAIFLACEQILKMKETK